MTEHYTLDVNRIPYDDHLALVRMGYSDFSATTVDDNAIAWRSLLAAIASRDDKGLQRPLVVRLTPETLAWLVADLSARLTVDDVISKLSNLYACARFFLPDHDFAFVKDQMAALRQVRGKPRARGKGPKLPTKAVTEGSLTPDHKAALKRLDDVVKDGMPLSKASKRYYGGEWLRFIGALERTGVQWKNQTPAALLTAELFACYESTFGHEDALWERHQRVNAFACGAKLIVPDADVGFLSARAAALRALNPDGLQGAGKKNMAWEKVPKEERDRLDFVFRDEDDEDEKWTYRGVEIDIARTPYSDATQGMLRDALRALHSALSRYAPDLEDQDLEERDYKGAVEAYEKYFGDCAIATRVIRLEKLEIALSLILPTRSWWFLRKKIGRLRRNTPAKPVTAPKTPLETMKAATTAALDDAYQRLIDLKPCPNRYRSIRGLAERYRNLLIIRLLIADALRQRTLNRLDDKRNVKRPYAGAPFFILDLEAAIMKERKAAYHDQDVGLTIWIDRYRDDVRALICVGEETDAFWWSRNGAALSRSRFQNNVPALTEELFGERLTVQQFRRVDATDRIGEGEPDDYRLENGLDHDGAESHRWYRDKERADNAPRDTVMTGYGDEIFSELGDKGGDAD